jgi:tetratricopeptide (TPR) repeat protein
MAEMRPRLEELQRRVQQDPASIAFAALAEEYRRLGMFAEAIETCRAGLQRHPAYLSARVTLGRALLERGEFAEAQEHLEQVLKTAPENLAAIRALADIHSRRGDLPEALDHYKAALSIASAQTDTTDPAPQSAATTAAPTDAAVPSEPAALAGLEEFLSAIMRLRREAAGGLTVASR